MSFTKIDTYFLRAAFTAVAAGAKRGVGKYRIMALMVIAEALLLLGGGAFVASHLPKDQALIAAPFFLFVFVMQAWLYNHNDKDDRKSADPKFVLIDHQVSSVLLQMGYKKRRGFFTVVVGCIVASIFLLADAPEYLIGFLIMSVGGLFVGARGYVECVPLIPPTERRVTQAVTSPI